MKYNLTTVNKDVILYDSPVSSLVTSDKPMIIELTASEEIINAVLDNPLIFQMVTGTGYTKPFDVSYREVLTKDGFKFLSLTVDSKLVGLFSFRNVTSITVESHIHILPEYHKKGYGKEAVLKGLEYFRNQDIKTVITYVPSNCFHVLKFMKDNDFEACGAISNAFYYNNELTQLYIFSRGL